MKRQGAGEAVTNILQIRLIFADTFGLDLERFWVELPRAFYKQSFLVIVRFTSAIFGLESKAGRGERVTAVQQEGLKQMTL